MVRFENAANRQRVLSFVCVLGLSCANSQICFQESQHLAFVRFLAFLGKCLLAYCFREYQTTGVPGVCGLCRFFCFVASVAPVALHFLLLVAFCVSAFPTFYNMRTSDF